MDLCVVGLEVFVSFGFNKVKKKKKIALLTSISKQRDSAPIPSNSCYFQDTNARKHFKTAQHSHKAFITILVGLLFNEIPIEWKVIINSNLEGRNQLYCSQSWLRHLRKR